MNGTLLQMQKKNRFLILQMKYSIKPRLPFSICKVFFVCNLLDFHFTSLQLVLVHYSADYIFISFGIIFIFENGVLSMYTVEGVSSVANHYCLCRVSIKPRLPFFYL